MGSCQENLDEEILPLSSEILAKAISIYEISAWTDNSDFMDQVCLKKVFLAKNRNREHTTEFCLFELG